MKALVLYLKCEAEHPRQQIAHRRAALSGRQAIERWAQHLNSILFQPRKPTTPEALEPFEGFRVLG